MGNDRPYDGGTPDPIVERRAGEGEPDPIRNNALAEADDDVGRGIGAAGRSHPSCDVPDPLGEIGDALIQAHHRAKLDGDASTVLLIEKALLHVGRRLARRIWAHEAEMMRH